MACQTDLTLNCPQPGNGAKASFALWANSYAGASTTVNCFGELDFVNGGKGVPPTKGFLTVALDLGSSTVPVYSHPCGGQDAAITLSMAENGGNFTVQNLMLPGVSSPGQGMSGPITASY